MDIILEAEILFGKEKTPVSNIALKKEKRLPKNTAEQKQKLNALLPMAMDEYRLTMEEVFLNEMEEKKYDITKIFEK